MVHLGVQHPFGQGFLQIVEQTIRIESRLGVGAGQQLVEKGIRNTGFFASRHGRAPLLPSCPTPHEIPDSPRRSATEPIWCQPCAPHSSLGESRRQSRKGGDTSSAVLSLRGTRRCNSTTIW